VSEQDLIGKAQAVLGDRDAIVAAAWFEPRGTDAGIAGGNAIGGGMGRALGGGLGGAIGSLAGAAIGYETAKHTEGFGVGSHDGATVHQVPGRSMVALSATHLYGWRVQHKGLHEVPTDELFTIQRSDLTIAVHARIGVHTFEVHAVAANETWEFEAGRIDSRLKYLIEQLHEVDQTPAPV